MAICRDREDEFRVSTELLIQCAEDKGPYSDRNFSHEVLSECDASSHRFSLTWSVGSRGSKHPKALSLGGNFEMLSVIFCRLFMSAVTMAFVNSSQAN